MSAKGQRAKSDLKKQASEIDSDEYQDMVFDIDYGRQLVQNADDFLSDKKSKVLEGYDSTSQGTSSNKDFVNQNRGLAFQKNQAYNTRKNKQRLDPQSQERYDQLLANIDANLEAILKEKQDYYNNQDIVS